MKSFIEEYGLIVVAILIIGIFIIFAPTFGNTISQGINQTVNKFNSKAQDAVN